MRTYCFAIAVLLSLVTASCKKSESPTGAPDGGGNTDIPISNAQRVAAFEAVRQLTSSLDWQNEEAAKATLIQFLHTRSEFEDAGPSDGPTVWARFTDGRLFIIAANRPSSDTLDQTQPDMPVTEPGREIPLSGNARLMNAMGTRFINTSATLGPMLQSKGYAVTTQSATVENLRTVAGDGVFYISTHGGSGMRRNGSFAYSLWTSTPFDTLTDFSLRRDWQNGYLAYFEADHNMIPGSPESATRETHFAITKEFVQRYMSFGHYALIYLDACGANGGADFRDACVLSSQAGTAITAGWSNAVADRRAADAAYFIFDRLLGANRNHRDRENPPQRPFRYEIVEQDLVRAGLDRYTWPNGRVAFFTFRPTSSEFGILAPSIYYMYVNEYLDRLYLLGDFGSDPGQDGIVTVNDQPLVQVRWQTDMIECTIPRTGPKSAGRVVVTVRGHSSNSVPLTEWRGEVRITDRPYGSVHVTTTYQIHFRGDVHSTRLRPHETPQPIEWINTSATMDTRAVWSAGGSWTGTSQIGPCTWEEYFTQNNASGTINQSPSPNSSEFAFAETRMYPRNGTLVVVFGMSAHERIRYDDSVTITCPPEGPHSFSTSQTLSYGRYDSLELQFDQNFNIIGGGSQTAPTGFDVYPGLFQQTPDNALIEFSGMTANYPPSPTDTCVAPGRPVPWAVIRR